MSRAEASATGASVRDPDIDRKALRVFAYRLFVDGQWREMNLRSIAEAPKDLLADATPDGLMWDLLRWGSDDPNQIVVFDAMLMRQVRHLYVEWQQDSKIKVGEVLSIIDLINKHEMPLEADLIDKGLRLRDCPSTGFNWRDLMVIIAYLDVHSHLYAVTNPDDAGWDLRNMLLANVADSTAWLQWAKTKAAADGGDPPDQVIRPGVKPRAVRPGSKVKPMPRSRVRELAGLDKPRDVKDEAERKFKLEVAFK